MTNEWPTREQVRKTLTSTEFETKYLHLREIDRKLWQHYYRQIKNREYASRNRSQKRGELENLKLGIEELDLRLHRTIEKVKDLQATLQKVESENELLHTALDEIIQFLDYDLLLANPAFCRHMMEKIKRLVE